MSAPDLPAWSWIEGSSSSSHMLLDIPVPPSQGATDLTYPHLCIFWTGRFNCKKEPTQKKPLLKSKTFEVNPMLPLFMKNCLNKIFAYFSLCVLNFFILHICYSCIECLCHGLQMSVDYLVRSKEKGIYKVQFHLLKKENWSFWIIKMTMPRAATIHLSVGQLGAIYSRPQNYYVLFLLIFEQSIQSCI